MSENDSASSRVDQLLENVGKRDDFSPPETKKRKIATANEGVSHGQLEEKLGGIFCCAVCLDLPKAAIYQCSNGHLMCAGCLTHILADARLRDETATCPSCRVEISKSTAIRNLAVENAISELPSDCQFCNNHYPRNTLARHEEQECEKRIINCKYGAIGCPWKGPVLDSETHESQCAYPHRSGAEVMEALLTINQRAVEAQGLYSNIFNLLNYDKMSINDIQLKPYRTDEIVHRLYYESFKFSAFAYHWVVKVKINTCKREPTHSSERELTYQLILKANLTTHLSGSCIVLRGPMSDIKVKPQIYEFHLTEQNNESPNFTLPLPDTAECNRLLSAKTIDFRLIMFLDSK